MTTYRIPRRPPTEVAFPCRAPSPRPTDAAASAAPPAKLTYEHIPPREAYNSEPLRSYKLDQWWALEAGEPARYRPQQRGAGEYALCERCNNNNNTGSWYVPELARLVEAGATVIRSFPDAKRAAKGGSKSQGDDATEHQGEVTSVRMKIVGSYPGRFTKEMVAMLLAINDPSFGDAHPELREFVLERERRGLPDRYRLYLSIFDRDVARQVGRYTALRGIGTPSLHAFDATELSYPPYTYVLTIYRLSVQDDRHKVGERRAYGPLARRDRGMLRFAALVLLTALVAAGCGESEGFPDDWECRASQDAMEIHCDDGHMTDEQREWFDREGDTWSAFEATYFAAWPEGCELALELAGFHDALYYGESSVTAYDCQLEQPAELSVMREGVPDLPPLDPYAAGEELGLHDGCAQLFDLSPVGRWYYGDEMYDESICPERPVG